jgi:TonB family protein
MKIESFYSDQHLTYEELVEYSRGNLSNSEMHRLEQHLIGCELCNEALEGVGLLGYDKAESSIERIKEATGAKESAGLSLYHYIGIAASVLLIAVLGFVFTRTGDDPELLAEEVIENPQESKKELAEATDKIITTDSLAEDSPIDTTYLAVVEAPQETEQAIVAQPQTTAEQTDTTPPVVQPALTQPEVSEEVIIADLDLATKDSSLKTIAIEDSSLIAATEIAADEEQAVAKSRMAAPSQAQPTEEPAGQVEAFTGDYVATAPARGIRSYERYLKRNLKYPDAARENNIAGDVVLNVAINADGSIGEITVQTSMGYGCDQEAIRLVREGPEWSPATRGGTAVPDIAIVKVSFNP